MGEKIWLRFYDGEERDFNNTCRLISKREHLQTRSTTMEETVQGQRSHIPSEAFQSGKQIVIP